MSFLHLPVEIRLAIYSELFGDGIAIVDGGRQDTGDESRTPSMLPTVTKRARYQPRSAQILRTCKTILAEARPILYDHTVFRTVFQAFAGRLPVQMTSAHPSFPHVRHLEWQLKCDLLKKYDPTEVRIEPRDTQGLRSIRLICQAENWRDTACGGHCDEEVSVRGRQQVVDFAKLLQTNMASGTKQVTIVEDVKHISRGRVEFNIHEGRQTLSSDVRTSHHRHV